MAGLSDSLLQQIHPALVYCKTIGGTQAVAEDKDHRRPGAGGNGEQDNRQQYKESEFHERDRTRKYTDRGI